MRTSIALGLMSGTSCDGISAALVRLQGQSMRVLATRTWCYPRQLAHQLAQGPGLSITELSSLNMALGEQFARAALRLLRIAKVPTHRVEVIGSHGHTIYHGPTDPVPSTLQIGEPAVIAHRTGIPVVSDFRPRDLTAGGVGAPLVPYWDQVVFGSGRIRALQNLGGIANVTVVGRRITPLAFDTGPGMCLIDLLIQRASGGRVRYDANGRLARRGRIDHRAVGRFMTHPYFHQPPPKSTGRELFSATLLQRVFGARMVGTLEDRLATVTYATALSIAESYRRFIPHRLTEIIVSGGGTRNRTLMGHLTQLVSPVPVRSIEQYGIPTQAKEPAAFALLALRALHGARNHLPSTTGARDACVLGAIWPGRL